MEFARQAVATKTSLPILECLHLKGDGQRLRVTGANGDFYARMEVDSLLVIDCCAPAGRLRTLLSNFTGEDVELTATSIKGPQSAPLQTLPGSDFPEMTTVKGKRFALPGEAIGKVIMAASTDSTRYAINSVYFDARGFVVGTDGRRVHCVQVEAFPESVNIPSGVAKLMEDQSGVIRSDGKLFVATGDGWEFGGKLIEGQFFNWMAGFPKESEGMPVTADLITGIQVAMACQGADDAGVPWVEVYHDRILGPDGDQGYSSEIFETGISTPFRCAPGNLLEALKTAGEGAVISAGANEPIVIKNGPFKAVLMPMRIPKK